MPTYRLVLTCEMTGIESLRPTPESCYAVTLRCGQCSTVAETPVVLDPSEAPVEVKGSRGVVTLTWKCKFCKREGNISLKGMEKGWKHPTVQGVECRGVAEVVGWDPGMSSWVAVSEESGKSFAVDLSEGDWVDYDDDGGHPVDVTEPKGKLEPA